jgi:hypothetical protein
MPRFHIGAVLARLPGPKYAETLAYAEFSPETPLPRPGKFATWRRAAPASLTVGLVAPRSTFVSTAGPMRPDDTLTAGIEWLTAAADALEAPVLVIPTMAELSTGARDRDLVRAFCDRLRSPDRLLVWAPAGLWEPAAARKLATELGVEYGFDPLEHPARGDRVYARVRGVGARSRITEGMMMAIEQTIASSGAAEAYVTIESPRSVREATRLRTMLEASPVA